MMSKTIEFCFTKATGPIRLHHRSPNLETVPASPFTLSDSSTEKAHKIAGHSHVFIKQCW